MYGQMMHSTEENYDSVAAKLLELMCEHYSLNDPKNQ
jgi:hypothetical protein